jgi:hypothetical protein
MVVVIAHFGKIPYVTCVNVLLTGSLAFGLDGLHFLISLAKCAETK